MIVCSLVDFLLFCFIGFMLGGSGEGAPPPSAFSLADFMTALPAKQVGGGYFNPFAFMV